MASIKNKSFESYSIDELSQKYSDIYVFLKKNTIQKPLNETITNDDSLQSGLWTEAYKLAGYYYDKPSHQERNRIFNSFRFNFTTIFSQTKDVNELPEVNSRRDLLTWVCKKHNEYLELKDVEARVNCDYKNLRSLYGPNDSALKSTFGSSIKML